MACSALAHLSMKGYRGKDLAPLGCLSALRQLHVDSKTLVTMSGGDQLPSLEHLTLDHCWALSDIVEVARCVSLQTLELHSCKKANDLSALPQF